MSTRILPVLFLLLSSLFVGGCARVVRISSQAVGTFTSSEVRSVERLIRSLSTVKGTRAIAVGSGAEVAMIGPLCEAIRKGLASTDAPIFTLSGEGRRRAYQWSNLARSLAPLGGTQRTGITAFYIGASTHPNYPGREVSAGDLNVGVYSFAVPDSGPITFVGNWLIDPP